jgi:hypothetical protein
VITYAPTLTRIEDIEWMVATGESRIGAAARLGMKPRSLDTYLYRHGRADLVTALSKRDPDILLPHELKTPRTSRPTRHRSFT